MPINQIQFQRGLSLPDFLKEFGTEQQCEDALAKARWPSGWRCAHCSYSRYFHTGSGKGRLVWECFLCGYQSSSIIGTILENTKLPLTVWFLAMFCSRKTRMAPVLWSSSGCSGVSYPTAWSLKRKLLAAMGEREHKRRLGVSCRSTMPTVSIPDMRMAGAARCKRVPLLLRCKRMRRASLR